MRPQTFRTLVALGSLVLAGTLLSVTLSVWESAGQRIDELQTIIGRSTWVLEMRDVEGVQPDPLPSDVAAYESLSALPGVVRLARASNETRLTRAFNYPTGGVDPTFFEVRRLVLAQGRFFGGADEVVVGSEHAALFGETVPLVDLFGGSREARVVGVLEEVKTRDPADAPIDSTVYASLEDMSGLSGEVSTLYLETTPEAFEAAGAGLETWLIEQGLAGGYELSPLAERYGARLRDKVATMLRGALGLGVAAVALTALANLLGFYLNAALARLRLVGVRRAVGATRRRVLFEEVAAALPWALLGTLLALPSGAALGRLFGAALGLSVRPGPLTGLGLALGLTALVLVASSLPALWAARQPPAQALKGLSTSLPQRQLRVAGVGLALGVACLVLQAAAAETATRETLRLIGNVSDRVATIASLTTDETWGDPRPFAEVTSGDYRAFLASPLADDFARAARLQLYLFVPVTGPLGNADLTLRSYDGDLPGIIGARLLRGRLPEPGSLEVAVGEHLAPDLADGVGDTVRFFGREWRVSGVFATGETGIPGGVSNGDLLVPGGALRVKPVRSTLVAEVAPDRDAGTALAELADFFSARHPESMPFQAIAPDAYGLEVRGTLEGLTLAYRVLAAGLLLLGGAGLAAQLFVSISLRTREIGIRRAVGATQGAILGQFVLEALRLGVGASGVGLLLGVGLSYLLAAVQNTSFVVVYEWLGAALIAALLTAVLAGLVPSVAAARTEPVRALREG